MLRPTCSLPTRVDTGETSSSTRGADSPTAALTLTASSPNSVLFIGTDIRTKRLQTPSPGYTQRGVNQGGSNGNLTRLYIHDRRRATAGAEAIAHRLSSSVDWVTVGVVIRPRETTP